MNLICPDCRKPICTADKFCRSCGSSNSRYDDVACSVEASAQSQGSLAERPDKVTVESVVGAVPAETQVQVRKFMGDLMAEMRKRGGRMAEKRSERG